MPVRVKGAKNIYTLHDLVPLQLPYTTLDNKFLYLKLMKLIARKADHIVTVSENSKRDIVALLGAPENKVTNTYQAVDIPSSYLDFSIEELKVDLEGSFRLQHKNYLLFYGAIEPKKNVGRIIEAYLASNIDKPLVVVGMSAWKSDQELRVLTGFEGRDLLRKRKNRQSSICVVRSTGQSHTRCDSGRLSVALRGLRIANPGKHGVRHPGDHIECRFHEGDCG